MHSAQENKNFSHNAQTLMIYMINLLCWYLKLRKQKTLNLGKQKTAA